MPFSIGIFMSPWGGHAVFPNIYRDMRHPSKYTACLTTTYYVTFLIDISTAILGFLMFGVEVSDEVSTSILLTQGYPASLGLLMTALIAIIPIAKTPLSVRPIVSTLDAVFNLHELPEDAEIPRKVDWKKLARYALRPLVVGLNVYLAIIYPSFDRIIGLLGSSMITTICVVGPITFFHKLYYWSHSQIPVLDRKSARVYFHRYWCDWYYLVLLARGNCGQRVFCITATCYVINNYNIL